MDEMHSTGSYNSGLKCLWMYFTSFNLTSCARLECLCTCEWQLRCSQRACVQFGSIKERRSHNQADSRRLWVSSM